MVGPGKAIDTEPLFRRVRQFARQLLRLDRARHRSTRRPAIAYRLDFPDLSVEDIARGGSKSLRTLGIEPLYAVVWAPRSAAWRRWRSRRCSPASRAGVVRSPAAAAASPFAIALRSLQRETILSDPDWQGGQLHGRLRPPSACGWRASSARSPIARRRNGSIASAAGRADRRYRRCPRAARIFREFAVEDYLEAQADKFVRCSTRTATSTCRVPWTGSISRRTAARRAALTRAAAERALVIGVESDILFPSTSRPRSPRPSRQPGRHRVRAAGLARGARRLPGGHRAICRRHRPFPR